jgi:tRNA threonylcarbamoyladenosine biosynthesis protein TsaE
VAKPPELSLVTASGEETEKIGEFLGKNLAAGDVVALCGPLGSGKTTLVRGLARGLGVNENEVSSPTFVFVHEHPGRVPLVHIDLYRIEDPYDLPDTGIPDYLEGAWVAVVEWADRGGSDWPGEALTIRFHEGKTESHRRVTLSGSTPRYAAILHDLGEVFCETKR